jgi:hypothetical protein
MSDGVTWMTPGVRVGTRVGVGGVFLVQPAMMSARLRIATVQSRATLARCLMRFLLHIVKLSKSIPHILAFAKQADVEGDNTKTPKHEDTKIIRLSDYLGVHR